jgi:hypothetical protein
MANSGSSEGSTPNSKEEAAGPSEELTIGELIKVSDSD